MPRLTHSVPKYRKHKASGQAVVTLDGQDFYLGPYDSRPSRQEYDRLVGEWQQNGRRLSQDGQHHTLTIAELLNAYRKFAAGYYVKHGQLALKSLHVLDYLILEPPPRRAAFGEG